MKTNLLYPTPKVLPLALISIYMCTLWYPPSLSIEWRWYSLGGLSLIAFLLQGNKTLYHHAPKVLLIFYSLQLLGGILGLLRSSNTYGILYEGVGLLITILSAFLMSQLLIYKKTRMLLAIAIVSAAGFWSVEVLKRTVELGEAAAFTYHSLYTDGGDKNYISFIMAVSCAVLMTFALLWRSIDNNKLVVIFRALCILLSVVFVTTAALTYSRTGLSVCIIAFFSPYCFHLLLKKGFVKLVIYVSLVTIFVSIILIPNLQNVFPRWSLVIERLNPEYIYEFNTGRFDTMEKSLLLIIENPFIGVGLGQYKYSYVDLDGSRHALGTTPHSTILGGIAEGGILSAVSFFYLGYTYITLLRRKLKSMELIDISIMAGFLPFFLMSFFLDIGGSYPLMVACLSVINDAYIQKLSM